MEKKGSNEKGRPSITKDDIGRPMDFRHRSHVGWDPEKGFRMSMLDDDMKCVFQQAGITEDMMKDEDTRNLVYDIIEQEGGLVALKKEEMATKPHRQLPPPPPRSRPLPSIADSFAQSLPLPPPPTRDIALQPPPPSVTSRRPPAPDSVPAVLLQSGSGPDTGLVCTQRPPLLPHPIGTSVPLSPSSPHMPTIGSPPALPPKPPTMARPRVPPPPPPSGLPQGARVHRQSALLSQIQQSTQVDKGTPALTAAGGPADDRSTLLNAVHPGTKLNEVEDTPSASSGGSPVVAGGGGIIGALHMALASRQKQLQGSATIQHRQEIDRCHDPPSIQTSKFPEYCTLSSRRNSFVNWRDEPSYSRLAEAGFFYKGPDDMVTCFCCGQSLNDLRPTDDPFVEHARWNKECPFLLKTKGYDCVLAVSVAMADVCGPRGEVLPLSEVMQTQRLPSERTRARDVTGNEGLPALYTSSQHGIGTHSASATPVTATDRAHSESSNAEQLRDQLTCKVCMDRRVCITFRPCGHLSVCQECAASLTSCPICRGRIQERQLTFLS